MNQTAENRRSSSKKRAKQRERVIHILAEHELFERPQLADEDVPHFGVSQSKTPKGDSRRHHMKEYAGRYQDYYGRNSENSSEDMNQYHSHRDPKALAVSGYESSLK